MNHLAEETISRYIDNELPRPAREAAEKHLHDCPECRRALVHWQAFDALAHEVYPRRNFAAPTNRRSTMRVLLALAAGLCLMASVGLAWAAVAGRWPFAAEELESPPVVATVTPSAPRQPAATPSSPEQVQPVEAASLPAEESRPGFQGIVSDLAGNPLEGARVSAVIEHAARIAPLVHLTSVGTDKNGRFEIFARGMSALIIEKEGYLPTSVSNIQLLGVMGAKIEVRLLQTHAQVLQLSDSSGNPVAGARAEIVEGRYYGLSQEDISDEAGLLKLASSPMAWPGKVIFAPPLATFVYDDRGFLSQTPRPLSMGPGASLRVHLTRKGVPVTGAIVRLSTEAGQQLPPEWVPVTNAEGLAEFTGLAFPNEYEVTAQDLGAQWPEVDEKAVLDAAETVELKLEVPADYSNMVDGSVLLPQNVDNAAVRVYAEGYRYSVDEEGKFTAPEGARIAFESELLARQQDALVMQPGLELTVSERPSAIARPVDASGNPLAAVWLRDPRLLPQDTADFRVALSVEEGQLSLPLRESTYLLYSPELESYAFFDPNAPDGEVVLDQPTGAFEGHLKSADGTPKEGVLVTVMLEIYRWMAQTDEAGYFRMTDIPMNKGFRVMLSGAMELDASHADQKYFATATPAPVVLKMAADRPRVWGQVVYSDGSPAARVGVRLEYTDREEMRASDWNGAFVVEPEGGVQLTALAHEEVESAPVYATAETKSVRLQLPITPDPEAQWAAVERDQRSNDYKQMGLVFKMFANEQPNMMFPPMGREENAFHPEREKIYPEYLTDDSFFEWLEGDQTFYTGFALDSEEAGVAFLDAYAQLGAEGVSDVDLNVGTGNGTQGSETLYRLREGLPATDAIQSEVPVVFELPGTREESGGLVLYMDGHVEWVEYPGEFPMTEAFVNRLRQLRGLDTAPPVEGTAASEPPAAP